MRRIRRVLGLSAMVLVVLALVGLLVARKVSQGRRSAVLERLAEVVGPLSLESLAPAEVAWEDNAVPELAAGAAALLAHSGDPRVEGSLVRRPLARWNPEDIAAAERIVTFNAPALELLRRGGARRGASFGLQYREGMAMEIPNLLSHLEAARVLMLDGRLALLGGDDGRLVSDLAALERLGRALHGESLALFQLVGAAVERVEYSLIGDLLRRPAERELLARVAEVLGKEDRDDALLKAYRAETVLMATSFDELEEEADPLVPAIWHLGDAGFLEAIAAIRGSLDLPLPELEEGLAAARREHPSRLADQVIPDYSSLALKLRSAEAARRLVRLALELRLAAQQAGAYPASLADYPTAHEPVRLTGETPSYRRHGDGRATLAYPEAARLWKEDTERRAKSDPGATLEIELPAPEDAVG